EAMLPKFLAHVAGITARTAIHIRLRQTRQERSHADIGPIESGSFNLPQLPFGLREHFFSGCDAVELSICGNVPGPAHVWREAIHGPDSLASKLPAISQADRKDRFRLSCRAP